jgi:cation diffusion facilitator family transporter
MITKTGALRVSLFAILSVILVEGIAGILTGSLALLSDSAHAAFDSLSTFVLLVTTSLSLKPADEDHTYGHGKIEAIGALIGGVILVMLSGTILVLALLRLSGGNRMHPSMIAYAGAGYTITMDFLRMGILSLALKTGSPTVKADLYHAVSDFGSTVLVFVALALASFGYPIGDTAVSLVLATLLGYFNVRLIYTSSLDLSDAVSGKLVQSILREIRRTDEVLKCKELRVRRVGPVTYVDTIIAVSPDAELTDADSIASRVEANLTKLLGKSSIMIHVEPLVWEIPLERQIRKATSKVEGARGVHNLSVATIGGGLYVTLHVQVDPSLDLDKAHLIAESVEKGIQSSIPQVRQVAVHLEPSMPESTTGTIVDDIQVSDTIRSIVSTYPDVVQISSIMIYSTGEKLYINVHCLFKGSEPISEIHEMVEKIEDRIRRKFSKAIVTIHPEPVQSEEKTSDRVD